MPVRGTNGTHINATPLANAGTDHAHTRGLQIKDPVPKRCLRGCVLEIGRLAREPPVDLRYHYQKTLHTISLNASLNYAANSKGKERCPQKQRRGMCVHVRAPLSWTLRQVHTTPHPNPLALLLPGHGHHQDHHHLFHHRTTLPLIVFDPTYPLKWTSTLTRPMTLAWTLHR
jgi:hypothetical protein